MSTITLVPAYGRKYDTIAQMRNDWFDGKDFKIYAGSIIGTYCSIRDTKYMLDMGIDCVKLVSHNDIANVYS